jgi:hypothetical protein
MKPHRNADVIKAFADGRDCEFLGNITKKWLPISNFRDFDTYSCTRIKPEPKPDFEDYLFVADKSSNDSNDLVEINWVFKNSANLKLIWDGETGELKDAKVIK